MKTVQDMNATRLQEILDRIGSVRAVLIGDMCLDVYWSADMTKSVLSRETPHYPLPVTEERMSPGTGGTSEDVPTANLDLVNLGNYRTKIGCDDQNYYRPRKNIVNRPTSQGGKGWHFCADHQITVPSLYDKVHEKMHQD